MSTKHTPGPWDWRLNGEEYRVEATAGHICTVEVLEAGDKQARVDAALIAAAPEMLQRLKATREYLQIKGIYSHNLDAIIAKAEGREP